jgi:predicted transcriptional regulator of viral defense system
VELTKLEQKLLELFNDGDITTITNLYKLNKFLGITENNVIKGAMSRMVKKGIMIRLSRGKYLVTKSLATFDPLKLANYIFDGYIALSSALFIYGYNSTKSFSIWGITTFRKKTRKIDEYTYISLPMGTLVFGVIEYKGYKVSTRAKTLFDCIYNIHYLDDLGPVIALVRDMKKEDFNELLVYLKLAKNSSLIQRIGFFLEKAGAPKSVLTSLDSIKGRSVTRLDKKNGKCINYNSRWKVFDNINLNRFIQ